MKKTCTIPPVAGTVAVITASPSLYYTTSGDSITVLISSNTTTFHGVSFMYYRQTKEILQARIKLRTLLWENPTSVYLGIILWNDGVRLQITDNQFTSNTVKYNRFTEFVYATGTKIVTKNIDFSKLPQYDSLQVHVSFVYSASKNATPIFKFNKNDFWLKPLRDTQGITKYNLGTLNYNPNLNLPDTFYLTQGTSINIYDNNVAYVPIENRNELTYDWSESTIGTQTDTSIAIKGVNVGNYTIKLNAKNRDGLVVDYATAIVKVEPKAIITTIKELAVGNSLTKRGWQYQATMIKDTLGITTFTSIGTKNTDPYKCEGIDGWSYLLFSGATSPFYQGGKIDFQAYLTANSLATPDVIRFSSGVNEMFGVTSVATTIEKLTLLVDSALNQLPNVKITICLPSSGTTNWNMWMTAYPTSNITKYNTYILRIRQLCQAINEKFAYNKYSSRVEVNYDNLVVDRYLDYTDGVHLTPLGYKHLAKGQVNIINHINQ